MRNCLCLLQRWLHLRIKSALICLWTKLYCLKPSKLALTYRKLLKSGVRIFEFQPCKLHMKLLVLDDVSYVGSANLDKRSFRINVELMVRIEDAGLAAKLRELIDHMEASSVPMTRERYERESTFINRMRWRFAYWMSLADYRISKVSAG